MLVSVRMVHAGEEEGRRMRRRGRKRDAGEGRRGGRHVIFAVAVGRATGRGVGSAVPIQNSLVNSPLEKGSVPVRVRMVHAGDGEGRRERRRGRERVAGEGRRGGRHVVIAVAAGGANGRGVGSAVPIQNSLQVVN